MNKQGKSDNKKIIVMMLIISLLLCLIGIGIFLKMQYNLKEQEILMKTEEKASDEEKTGSKESAVDVKEEQKVQVQPEVTQEPEAEVSEAEEAAVSKAVVPEEGNPVEVRKVAIDAGHQGHGNSEKEPIGPGASQSKAKVTSGTCGRTTGVPEYVLNLDVSLKLRDELERRGYQVFMVRETHDVDISNSERAMMAADSGADIFVRIHANGSDNASVFGALTMAPSTENAFIPADLAVKCQDLSRFIIDSYCNVTGTNNQGVIITDTMSGLNWCTIPATIVEMGYMTNPDEDMKMQTEDYQNLMVQGIADGIDAYFQQ